MHYLTSPCKHHTIQHDDPFISNQVKDLSQVFLNGPSIAFMPWAKYVVPGFIGYTLVDKFYKNIRALFHGIISDHEREYDHESPPKVCFITWINATLDEEYHTFLFQDFIDAYLKEMKKDPSGIEREDLIGICLDFFEAGGDTVGSTLSWVFMYMALNQDEQEKCYNELVKQLRKII